MRIPPAQTTGIGLVLGTLLTAVFGGQTSVKADVCGLCPANNCTYASKCYGTGAQVAVAQYQKGSQTCFVYQSCKAKFGSQCGEWSNSWTECN